VIDVSQMSIAIDAQRQGQVVLIRPQLQNPTPLTLQYRMTVRTGGASGTSSVSQAGDLQTGPGNAVVSLSLPAGGTCEIRLQVFDGTALVKEATSGCE
jgi:hypothetical protein